MSVLARALELEGLGTGGIFRNCLDWVWDPAGVARSFSSTASLASAGACCARPIILKEELNCFSNPTLRNVFDVEGAQPPLSEPHHQFRPRRWPRERQLTLARDTCQPLSWVLHAQPTIK